MYARDFTRIATPIANGARPGPILRATIPPKSWLLDHERRNTGKTLL
jgi:hypothetical protein